MNRNLLRLGLLVVLVAGYPKQGWAQGDASSSNAGKPAEKPPADVLVFTNGDRLTGKLDHAAGGNVVFKSDMAGEITIPFSKIKELRSGSEFVALRKGAPGKMKPAGSGTVDFAEDKLTLKPTAGVEQTMVPADLGYLVDAPSYAKAVDHHAGFREGWNGSGTAGLSLVRSTVSSTTFTAAVNLVRAIPSVPYLPDRNRTMVNVVESYGKNTSPVIPQTVPASPAVVVKTNIFHADAERDQYFSPRFYALGDVAFDHNFSQGLQLQQLYGLGAGWTPVQDAKQELDLRGDLHYEKQEFLASANNENLIGSTFQENYRRNLPRKLIFTEWANILPAWNNSHAYSANGFLSLATPVYKRFSAVISVTDNYLNNPSPGYRTNSVQYVMGVTYTMK